MRTAIRKRGEVKGITFKNLDWAENEGTRMNDIHSWGLQGRENFGEDIKGPRGAQQDMKAEVNDE